MELLDLYLQRIKQRYNSYSVIKAAADIIKEREDEFAANVFLKEQLLKRPSLRGLREWVRQELAHSKPKDKLAIQVILDMLDKVVQSKPLYLCTQCGFQAKAVYWQCPSCRTWNSVKPVIGLEGE